MKKFSKALSLLLAVCMIMGTFSVVFADEVTLPGKLLDLNLDGMSNSWTTTNDGGVVNAGTTGNDAIFSFKSSTGGGSQLKKSSLTNSRGEVTDYIYISNPGYNWANGHSKYIVDNNWETTANTISFWTDINHNTDYAGIVEYYIVYNHNGTEVKQGLAIDQIFKESNSNYLWNIGYSTTDAVNMNNSKGWSYVTITNPVLANGSKTMDVYINGKYFKSKTLEVPAGATLTSATMYLGGHAAYPGYPHMAQEIMYGDLAVYDGILNSEQITKIYTEQAPKYVPFDIATAEKLFDLDVTNYVAERSTTITESSGGATNAGTSETALINMYTYAPYNGNEVFVTKKQMTNANGELVDYFTRSSKLNWGHAASAYVGDNAWEENDSTISFWMTPNMHYLNGNLTDGRIQAAYNVTYVDDGGTETTVRVPIWRVTKAGFNTSFNVPNCVPMIENEFNHIAMVNRKVDASGNKTVDIYVNGIFYTSVSLTQPAGTTLKSAVLSFGEYYPIKANGSDNNTGNIDYAKVQVYKGAFTAGDIKTLYDLQKSELTSLALADVPVLLDLNLDNFRQTTEEGSSGITNAGTSESAVIDIHTSEGKAKVEKRALMSSDLTTEKPYIYMNHVFGHSISSDYEIERHFDISDLAWEEKPVTITFWADLDRSAQQTSSQSYLWIAQYDVEYKTVDLETGEEIIGNVGNGLAQNQLDTDTNYYWAKGLWNHDISMHNSREWSHVAMIVSPVNEAGKKTINIYVNGVDQGSMELTIPEGAEITNATLRFGGNKANKYVPGDLSIADVKVYGAFLTGNLIKEIYESERATYENAAEAKVRFYNVVDDTDKAIQKLNGIANDGTASIKIKYTETIEADYKVIVAAYGDNVNFISANYYDYDAESTNAEFDYQIPAGTKYLKAYIWKTDSLSPIQKIYEIQYNDI